MTRDELERMKVRLRLGQPFGEDDIESLIEAAGEAARQVYCPACEAFIDPEEEES